MSTALAIGGVTAVLRDRLNDGLVNHNITGMLGSTVSVSVLPPDRVVAEGDAEASQLNLFLYQVTPSTGWRNQTLPAYDADGRHRLSNPPLALDLHYLVSAYSAGDLHAEILLGYAMQLMHEFPVLTRAMIQTALNPSPDVGTTLPPALRALADCGLADQVEPLRITPQFMNSEEMSKLWTACQASYRPSAAYQVSVVLIQADRPTRPSLPVLTRGVVATPSLVPPLPMMAAVLPGGNQPVVQLDVPVQLQGHHLDGSAREVMLHNQRHAVDAVVPATGAGTGSRMDFVIPATRSAEFPVGIYEVTIRLVPAGETALRESNRLACVVAPQITNLPQSVARDGSGDALITIMFTPELRAGQTVSLLLGQQEIRPQGFSAPTRTLDFLARAVDVGSVLASLRIDGIDSPLADRSQTPPVFFNQRVTFT